MARIALAVPPELEARLLREATRHGHEVVARCANARELAAACARVDSALVAARPRYLDQTVLAATDAAGVRMVALCDMDADRRYALTLGLLETCDSAAEWGELEGMLLGTAATAPPTVAPTVAPRSAPTAAPPPVERGGGRVVAVWGPAGSPGRTTLAIAIAAELAGRGLSVALADVDTYSGTVAPMIGLLDEAPGFAAACRLAGAGALNHAELERIAERYRSHSGSFWVLTGIARPTRWPELSADRVTGVIMECRSWVDWLVIDTGASLENDEEISSDLFAPRRNAATIAALREADEVIAIGAGDPVGIARLLRAYVDLVDTVDSAPVTVVMNRMRASAIGLGALGQVRQTLQRFGDIRDPVFVPHDQAALDAAVLSGKTLADVAPRSPVRAAVAHLVTERLLQRVE